jgi:hypothetical protein
MDGEDDLRGDIESALGGNDGDASGEAAPPSSAPAQEPSTSAPGPASDGAAAEADGASTGAVAERDSLGRFLPKKEGAAPAPTGAGPVVPAAGQPSQPATPGAAPTPEIQPPAGWGPAVREHWAATPLPIREQIVQREQQMQQWANNTANARMAGQAFMQAIEPHRMTIQAEGVDAMTAVSNLMQFTTQMRFGTQAEKANLVSQLVKVYGVDVQALDAALAGVIPPPGPQPSGIWPRCTRWPRSGSRPSSSRSSRSSTTIWSVSPRTRSMNSSMTFGC